MRVAGEAGVESGPELELVLGSVLPGRVRWKSPRLYRQPRLAAAVELALLATPGVREARVNPLTGSVLIRHEEDLTSGQIAERLAAAIEEPPLDGRAFRALQERRAGHAHTPDHPHHPHHGACGHEHEHDDEEVAAFRRNLVLGGTVLGAALLGRLIGGPAFLATNPIAWIAGVAATTVTGLPFFKGAWRSFSDRRALTTDTLVSSATAASLLLGERFTGLSVIWLLNLGEYLQLLVLERTRRSIRALLSVEEQAWVVLQSGEAYRPVESIRPGDLVALYTGTRVPVDGTVDSGTAVINEAPITGESMPVIRNAGDPVYAGTVLLNGSIRVRVERVGSETAVGRLIQRVEEAQESRAPIQTIGERFAARFVPASFVLAALVLLVTRDVRRALTMLLVACPCASGLATPTAVSAAIGNGARRGILIKGGRPLELVADVDVVVFDKTGTLTEGSPSVERVVSLTDDYTANDVLSLAANGELHSQHPLGVAVVDHARGREIFIPAHDECESFVGRGIRADWSDNRVLVGNRKLLAEFGIGVPSGAEAVFREHTAEGETMMYVAHQERVIGLIGVRDKIRLEAAAACTAIRRLGVGRCVMLTGDAEETATAVAGTVGIREWQSRLMPDQKYALIEALRTAGHRVAMVGDGINDAPALALADVGIAMGTVGSDVAIEASDIALAADNLLHVATAMRLSKETIRMIRQNYAVAIGVNGAGVAVSAFGVLNPFLAAVLHNLSTLLVVLNSARIVRYDPDGRPAWRLAGAQPPSRAMALPG